MKKPLWKDHVESNPDILGGEPVIRGTRIPARAVAAILRDGGTVEELQEDFGLAVAQIEAAVQFDKDNPL